MILPAQPFTDYQAAAGWNATAIKAARSTSLAQAKAIRDGTWRKESSTLDRGRMLHTYLLEPERFDSVYMISGLSRNSTAFKTLAKENPDATWIKPDDSQWLIQVQAAVDNNPVATDLLKDSTHEVSCFATCPDTELPLKARLDGVGDAVTGPVLYDLKFTTATDLHAFGKQVARYGYDIQFAHYRDVYLAAENNPMGNGAVFYCIALFTAVHPIECAVFRVTSTVMMSGNHKRKTVLARIAECEAAGVWPGLVEGGQAELPYPDWAIEMPELDWGGVEDDNATQEAHAE